MAKTLLQHIITPSGHFCQFFLNSDRPFQEPYSHRPLHLVAIFFIRWIKFVLAISVGYLLTSYTKLVLILTIGLIRMCTVCLLTAMFFIRTKFIFASFVGHTVTIYAKIHQLFQKIFKVSLTAICQCPWQLCF